MRSGPLPSGSQWLRHARHALVLVVAIAPSNASAQPCIDYSDNIRPLGNVDAPGLALDVVLAGNVAYVACNTAGLALYDLTAPDGPALLSSIDTPGTAHGVAVSGSHAYVADFNGGFRVVDVSNPLAPAIVGSVAAEGVRRVVVAGNYAYVVGSVDFRIVDVSNPAAPQVVGTLTASSQLRDVTVSGTTAFCAAYDAGLLVVDVSSPASPSVLGSVDTPDLAFGVAVDGNIAYLANREAGLQIIDVTNPAVPVVVGDTDVPAGAVSVTVAGNIAYVGQPGRLRTFDVTNPAAPVLIGGVESNDTVNAMALDGERLILANNTEGLGAVAIENPTWRAPVGSYAVSGGSAVAREDVRLYVGGHFQQVDGPGLLVLDVTINQAAPAFVGQVATSGAVRAIACSGQLVYAAAHLTGLQVIDASNPAAPVVIGTANLTNVSELNDAAIEGTHVYLAAGAAGLHIVDVAAPSAPAGVGTFDTPGTATSLVVIGSYAFVADGSALRVIDVSNPAVPSQVADVLPSGAADVARLGSQTLAVLDWDGVVHEVDVSNPLAPVAVELVATYGYPSQLNVTDGVAYASGGGILQVADVAGLESPTLLGGAGPVGSTTRGIVWGPGDEPTDGPGGAGHVYLLSDEGIQVFPAHCRYPTDTRVTDSGATLQAWPNPGRGQIAFAVDLPRGGDVVVEVFDVAGRRVREVLRGRTPAGRSMTHWDGRDDAGRRLPGSVYFVRLSGAGVSTQRVTLLR